MEISEVVFEPEERAPDLPPVTAAVPYTMRVRGSALEEAEIGDVLRIRTLAGRVLSGRLSAIAPAFRIDYGGEAVPELIEARREMMSLMRREHE